MNGWGWILVAGTLILAVLAGFLIRVFRRPKKAPIKTYNKRVKKKKTKKKNGKSH